jgi:sporulation protein YlmC with PRC-barrel domain
MRTLTYSLIGIFFLSLLLVATPFADERAIQWDSFVATDLLGRDLETSEGEYIGNIDDLAINPSTGRIDSVLVNNIIGAGAQVVAIPFDDISKIGQNIFVYNPPEGMYQFYGKTPYWSYGLNELPPMREGHSSIRFILWNISLPLIGTSNGPLLRSRRRCRTKVLFLPFLTKEAWVSSMARL